jgi:hypothetical protein
MKTEKYKPEHEGKNIIISWHEFYYEFRNEIAGGMHVEDWLPPDADPEAIDIACKVYADQMIEWHGEVMMQMLGESGYELEVVRDVLKDAGYDYEEGGEDEDE